MYTLCSFPECHEVVSEIMTFRELNLSGDKDIKTLPASLSQLINLLKLDVLRSGSGSFPEFIYEMHSSLTVSMRNVNITVLNEKMVRHWYENLAIWDGAGFVKTEGLNV